MTSRNALAQLRSATPAVLPSLLLCDFGNLAAEVARLTTAGVRGLHLDVMDGQFVPNLTYGMPIVEAVRRLTDLPLDVHLMIARPERYIDSFVAAGSDVITVHIEAVEEPRRVLEQIRAAGVGAGLALNPATPLSTLEGCLDACDLVLVMSVPAGFGGQSFQPVALEKLRALREQVGPDVLLEVDGGVNQDTIGDCSRAGAGLFVVGSGVFRASDYGAAIRDLQGRAEAVRT